MKKFLLSVFALGVCASASAIFLVPQPTLVSETINADNVAISWQESAIDPAAGLHTASYYDVILFKKHKATENETLVLAQSDFSEIISKHSIKDANADGSMWHAIESMPGWYVKFPMYANGALGVDACFYFPGSDNNDPLGGTYIASPDYDLSKVKDPAIEVAVDIARSNNSDGAGIAVYTWSDDFYTEGMEDYKPIMNQVWESNEIDNEKWTPASHVLVPDQYAARTRVVFYGYGYGAVLYDNVKVTIDLVPGDEIVYAFKADKVEGTNYTIDTSKDTDNDFVYSYQIKGIWEDYDEYRERHYIRSLSEYSTMKVIGKDSGVENVAAEIASDVTISAAGGAVTVTGTDAMSIYNVSGQLIYSGSTLHPVSLPTGLYIVKAADQAKKIIL